MALPQLIDKTYFAAPPLFLSQVNTKAEDRLNGIILFYQEVLARWVLGDLEFYKYEQDWNGSGWDSQKWEDFTEGINYIIDGKTVQWKGFKDLLTYFVYYFYLKNENTKTVINGEIKIQQENAENVSPIYKMIELWNRGIEFYGLDWQLKFKNIQGRLINSSTCKYVYNTNYYRLWDYDCYKHIYIDESIEKFRPSAYNFLLNRYESDFPDWTFFQLSKINIFGI